MSEQTTIEPTINIIRRALDDVFHLKGDGEIETRVGKSISIPIRKQNDYNQFDLLTVVISSGSGYRSSSIILHFKYPIGTPLGNLERDSQTAVTYWTQLKTQQEGYSH